MSSRTRPPVGASGATPWMRVGALIMMWAIACTANTPRALPRAAQPQAAATATHATAFNGYRLAVPVAFDTLRIADAGSERWSVRVPVGAGRRALNGQDGARTNWDGVFTEAQAARGQQAYRQACASCHLDDLLGERDAPPLAGAPFSNRWAGSTADDMLQTIRRTMPQEAPDSLDLQAYVDIISYLLKVNGSPAGAAELPPAPSRLRQIRITTGVDRGTATARGDDSPQSP